MAIDWRLDPEVLTHLSVRVRLFLAFFLMALAIGAGLTYFYVTGLERSWTRELDQRVTNEAVVLSAALSAEMQSSGGTELRQTQIEKLTSELAGAAGDLTSRVRILDRNGRTLVDSSGQDARGVRYADTPEVAGALKGERSTATRVTENGGVAVLVAEPVLVKGEVAGVVYTSGTTSSVQTLFRQYRTRVVIIAILVLAGILGVSDLLARRLSAPLRDLTDVAVAFAAGDHSVRARPEGSVEVCTLADSFNAMADEVQDVMSELKEEERRKSRFVSDVSHELRTPLTAIRGAAETLLEGDVPEDDARQFLSTMVRESDRLSRLADDLITLQRIEGATGELPISRVDLAEAAQNAIDSLAPLTEARGVNVVLKGEAPLVLGDRDRLQQVFGNLLDNASRMTPEGKTVTITLSAEGDEAVAQVLDEGPGISDEALPHVFDRFYRSQASRDRSTGGAGLGLAIVAAIVKAHTGTIDAARRDEGGTAFTMRIPALRD